MSEREPRASERDDGPVSDPPDDAAVAGDGTSDATERDTAADGPSGRDVEVPLDVYKAVTVFSTLFAVLAVVAGFVLLDVATQRATAAPEDVNVLIALLGLGAIGLGAATYAFSTRFRARGMGNAKDGADQGSDNG